MRPYETNGQYLHRYLLDTHFHSEKNTWKDLGRVLVDSNRGKDWVEAFREMACLQLMRRLIVAGDALFDEDDSEHSEVQIKHAIIDTMEVHWASAGDICERLIPAVRSARSEIANGSRGEAKEYARREMPYCYLCGVEIDFGATDHLAFTLDHIWPRAYGGNSDLENILGACRSCNEAKDDAASWALYPVQAMVHGFRGRNLEIMPKIMRFAIQAKEAISISDLHGISLREAFTRLGRPDLPEFSDGDAAGDVFNYKFVRREE